MATPEKESISDFAEIFQESYDRIPDEQKKLSDFFEKVNTWYYKTIDKEDVNKEKPELLYQYLESKQTEYIKFQTELSGITKAVYLVVKDVAEIAGSDTESYQKSDYIKKEGDPDQPQRQVINVNTAKPSIFHKLLRKKEETNLPKSLEDAWVRSENWKDEIRNIPQIWKKLIVYHHYGVQWQNEFDGFGMVNYRNNEITFLNTRIEPVISNIVMRALDIREEKQTEKIERIYTGTLQMEKELETARLMSGQATTPEESRPKSS